MLNNSSFIICLMGPTASGKTKLAMDLARYLPCEIVSVDSAMVYQEMDIGTAKPSSDMLDLVPHHLIDICDPADSYSAAQFRQDAMRAILDIQSRGKIPLLVGGTMLYFRALQKGLSHLPVANTSVRLALKEQADQIGWTGLHERLVRIDPNAANRIHPNDKQRIQRALEVYEISGKTLTDWHQQSSSKPTKYCVVNIGIIPSDRHLLHQQIELRFDEMLENGFLEEVRKLFERPDLNLENPSVRSVGYRQVWEYFLEYYDKVQMRDRAIFATRQLAKRQLTWLRGWTDLISYDSGSVNLLNNVLAHILKELDNKGWAF